ncbi:hypothetical protein [Streptomyces sp. NPDC058614]|uniref:hypothetical protein n=1 Tax=Streptomyces sp. NPDC058614 TaxID=3346557 RepID=UPI003668F3FC
MKTALTLLRTSVEGLQDKGLLMSDYRGEPLDEVLERYAESTAEAEQLAGVLGESDSAVERQAYKEEASGEAGPTTRRLRHRHHGRPHARPREQRRHRDRLGPGPRTRHTEYPLGGFVTHHLLRGDPRKIVLAHSGITVASGNHRAEGHRPANRPPVPVHQFKWRPGVGEDAERRASHSDHGTWKTASPARLSEARRLLDHLQRHDGRIGVGSSRIPFRPVTLQAVPGWWAEEATRLVTTWRPPACGRGQKDPGGMISSPSS